MKIDLVSLTTSDRVVLPGGYLEPAGIPKSSAIDAVLLNPGTSQAFYNPVMTGIAAALAEAGYAALAISTRGHDVVFRDMANGRYLGAAYERIADCTYDFDAGMAWLGERGFQRIAVLGHSLGATKATYYAAHEHDSRLAAVINCSGPRWSASTYLNSDRSEPFIRCRTIAEQMVAEGRGEELAELDFPLGKTFFTANNWLDKYGAETYNIVTWAHRVTVPLFRLDGENEADLVPRDVSEDLMRLAVNSPHRRSVLIPGADHSYTGLVPVAAKAIVEWINELP